VVLYLLDYKLEETGDNLEIIYIELKFFYLILNLNSKATHRNPKHKKGKI
jgi:hypothetical protein